MLSKTIKIGDTVHKIESNYPYCVQTGKITGLHKTFLEDGITVLNFVDVEWFGNKNPETMVYPGILFTDPIEAVDDYISKAKSEVENLKKRIDQTNHIIDVLREERKKLKGDLPK